MLSNRLDVKIKYFHHLFWQNNKLTLDKGAEWTALDQYIHSFEKPTFRILLTNLSLRPRKENIISVTSSSLLLDDIQERKGTFSTI